MNRSDIRNYVRNLLRLVNVKPFDDNNINDEIESAIDDLSNRVPFSMAFERTHAVPGQREYLSPVDSLQILQVYYKDECGTFLTLATNDSHLDGTILSVNDTTGFPDSGTVVVDGEEITYTSKTATTFLGCTIAKVHYAGEGVIESGKSWSHIPGKSDFSLASDDTGWLSASGAPSSYYTYPGVIGFDSAPSKTGFFNIAVRCLIRPPALAGDDDKISSLIETFVRAIARRAAHALAVRLAEDEASQAQAARWLQDYIADVKLLEKRQQQYEKTMAAGFSPESRMKHA